MKIEMNKKYRTRDGRQVRIYAVDGGGTYTVHAAILQYEGYWGSFTFTEEGLFSLEGTNPDSDLVEVEPYDHIKVDDKVIVWNDVDPDQKYYRYFAGVSDGGSPLAWNDGATSWSADGRTSAWDNCELLENQK